MVDTYNEVLRDAMVAHQTGLLRYAGSVRNRINELLDATETDIRRVIQENAGRAGFDTSRRRRRLDAMLAAIREIRLEGWSAARSEWFAEMRRFAVAEPEFADGIVKAAASGVRLETALPAAATLRNIVTTTPFQGRTLRQWADNLQRRDLERFEQQINIGLAQNETPPEIARRIVGTVRQRGRDGVTQTTRRQADTVVRTTVNGIGAEARERYFEANSDLLGEKVFLATLDSRTTPICRSLDGKRYAVGDPNAPRFPLHMGERSLYSPVLDGEVIGRRPRRAFTEQQLVREYSDANELGLSVPSSLSAKEARDRLPRGTKGDFDAFARRRMRELTGTVPATTTYQEFARGLSAAQQDDILGPTRGALFRRGGLQLDQFVMRDGSELTLAQLKERHRQAFIAAGLDPDDF